MTRKHVRVRQERNVAIGRQDAAHRCQFCKRALPPSDVWSPWKRVIAGQIVGQYCSDTCALDAEERDQVMEARR
jgi:hypothetical protein